MWNIPLESDGEEELLKSESYRKMDDVQLVLRFFAYRFLDKLSGYTIEDFLDEYLKQANIFPERTLNELENLFIDTIETIYSIFGKEAFFSPAYVKKVHRPGKTVYDSLMQSVAKHINNKEILLENKDGIKKEKFTHINIMDEDRRVFDGRDNIPSAVQTRIEYFDKLFELYIK